MRLDLSKVKISAHATERGIQRLKINDLRPEKVNRYIKKQLENATYIGRIKATDGSESEMFAIGSYGFMLSPDLTTVKTVVINDRLPYNPVHDKVKQLFEKEFRKLNRAEKAKLGKLELHNHEVEAEIAELKLRIYKTKSESVKLACQARIASLNTRLGELNVEIQQLQADKRQIAYALAGVI